MPSIVTETSVVEIYKMIRILGRKKSNRLSLMRNLATSLFLYESIKTTEAKAKELRSVIDKMIIKAKPADLNATRYLTSRLFDKNAVKKVIREIVPRYKNRNSGFTKIIKLENRLGDRAPLVLIELVDKKVFVKNTLKKELSNNKNKVKTKISAPESS